MYINCIGGWDRNLGGMGGQERTGIQWCFIGLVGGLHVFTFAANELKFAQLHRLWQWLEHLNVVRLQRQ